MPKCVAFVKRGKFKRTKGEKGPGEMYRKCRTKPINSFREERSERIQEEDGAKPYACVPNPPWFGGYAPGWGRANPPLVGAPNAACWDGKVAWGDPYPVAGFVAYP